jgi:hypothetical protein
MTKRERITLVPDEKFPDTTGWKRRHLTEVKLRRPIVLMFEALECYAELHFERYESSITKDFVLGPAWEDQLRGLRTLLDGETGGLDCGTFDAAICKLASREGVEL